jgi:protein SCO1/2
MKSLLAILLAMLSFGSSAVAEPSYPASSLYNLDADLTNQSGQSHHLDVYAGEPVLITLFYGSCPMACPLLIDSLRAVERATPGEQRKKVRVLMISIDPKNDTPEALLKLARERHLDLGHWTLARTDERTVRKIAALLNIQYRALPNGGYNHSSVITLLTPTGEIAAQSSKIGTADPALVDVMRALRTQSAHARTR